MKISMFGASLIIVGLILFVVLAIVGGSGNALDVSIVHTASAQRLAHPGLTSAGVAISIGGGAPAIIGLAILAFMFLVMRQHWHRAIALVGIILGGRLMVDLIKAAVARPRPIFHATGIRAVGRRERPAVSALECGEAGFQARAFR